MKQVSLVIHGAGQGSELLVPTANLQPEFSKIPEGIYAIELKMGEDVFYGVGYRGRAHLLPGKPLRAEVHLFDYRGANFYGEEVVVEWKKKLRDAKEFTSEDQAKVQIQADIEQAKAYFSEK